MARGVEEGQGEPMARGFAREGQREGQRKGQREGRRKGRREGRREGQSEGHKVGAEEKFGHAAIACCLSCARVGLRMPRRCRRSWRVSAPLAPTHRPYTATSCQNVCTALAPCTSDAPLSLSVSHGRVGCGCQDAAGAVGVGAFCHSAPLAPHLHITPAPNLSPGSTLCAGRGRGCQDAAKPRTHLLNALIVPNALRSSTAAYL